MQEVGLRLTPGRRTWLLRLLNSKGRVRRGQGPVSHDCMEAGWTEWAYFDPTTGELVGDLEAALARVGDPTKLPTLVKGEMLTAAGRGILVERPRDEAPPAARPRQSSVYRGRRPTDMAGRARDRSRQQGARVRSRRGR
jgi:hypothetical protein